MPSSDSVAGCGRLSRKRSVEQAMVRFAVLRPHLEHGYSVGARGQRRRRSPRTAQRWLRRYAAQRPRRPGRAGHGTIGGRRKIGSRSFSSDSSRALFLRKPRPSVATIHRRIVHTRRTSTAGVLPSYGSLYTHHCSFGSGHAHAGA